MQQPTLYSLLDTLQTATSSQKISVLRHIYQNPPENIPPLTEAKSIVNALTDDELVELLVFMKEQHTASQWNLIVGRGSPQPQPQAWGK